MLRAMVINIEFLVETIELSQIQNKRNNNKESREFPLTELLEQRECTYQIVTPLDLIKTSLGCGNLVLAPSHTILGETLVHVARTVAERADSVGFVWLKHFQT